MDLTPFFSPIDDAIPSSLMKDAEYKGSRGYYSLRDTVSKVKENESPFNGFHATLDHITHQRGQATIYLRSQGITPPDYMY